MTAAMRRIHGQFARPVWGGHAHLGAGKAWNEASISRLHRLRCRQMAFLCLKEDRTVPMSFNAVIGASSSRESEERRDGFILRMSLMYRRSRKVDRNQRTFFRNFRFYTRRKRLTGRIFLLVYLKLILISSLRSQTMVACFGRLTTLRRFLGN